MENKEIRVCKNNCEMEKNRILIYFVKVVKYSKHLLENNNTSIRDDVDIEVSVPSSLSINPIKHNKKDKLVNSLK